MLELPAREMPYFFVGAWGPWTITVHDTIASAGDRFQARAHRQVSQTVAVIASKRVGRRLALMSFALQASADLPPIRDGKFRVSADPEVAVITDSDWLGAFAQAHEGKRPMLPLLVLRLLKEPAIVVTFPIHLRLVYIDGPHPELEFGLEDAERQQLVRLYREFTAWGSNTAAAHIGNILNVPAAQVYNRLRALRRAGYLPAPGMGGRGRNLTEAEEGEALAASDVQDAQIAP